MIRKVIATVLLAAPCVLLAVPAQADEARPVSNVTHDVISFLGFGASRTENTAPPAEQPRQPASAGGMTRDVVSFLGFGNDQTENPTDPAPLPMRPKQALTPRAILPSAAAVDAPGLPAVVAATAAPSVETPLRRLFCVEYARMRSGLAVFGDAKHWWERARNLYARVSHPVEEAVMVFSGSKRLKRGHVAVVTDIVSPREIIVDQANWQNRGEIDHATPVLDVSKNNDWSLVRVWDIPSRTFGSRVYPISGFIAKNLTLQASNY